MFISYTDSINTSVYYKKPFQEKEYINLFKDNLEQNNEEEGKKERRRKGRRGLKVRPCNGRPQLYISITTPPEFITIYMMKKNILI